MQSYQFSTLRACACFALLACALFAGTAHAQLDVKIKASKPEYVVNERVPVGISVTNRSGRDVVLAGPNGEDWLDFQVYRGSRAVRKIAAAGTFEPTILKAGQTIAKTVDLSTFYSMKNYGFYTFQASVYFSPGRVWMNSSRDSARVVGARKLWTETFGTKRDRPEDEAELSEFETLRDEGGPSVMTLRTHQVLKYLGNEKTYLYYQLEDPNTQTVHTCYRLGELIDLRPPRFGIDSRNHAHVLFMIRPQLYAKLEIDTRGNVLEEVSTFYKEAGNSVPMLKGAPNGEIVVMGGKEYNPEEIEEVRRNMHRLSELPEGLLQLKHQAAVGE